MEDELTGLNARLQSGSVCFLTGAGVSVDSGVPDFKTVDENWSFPVSRDEALSVQLLQRNPNLFWSAYKYLHAQWGSNTGPNRFHEFVSDVQATNNHAVVLTQNVDGLQGDGRVLELHGNKDRFVCSRASCGEQLQFSEELLASDVLPKCSKCRKLMRPDIVLFGENVKQFREAMKLVRWADTLVVAGTSLQVAPVNALPLKAAQHGAVTVWVNSEPQPPEYDFTFSFVGSLDEFVTVMSARGTQENDVNEKEG